MTYRSEANILSLEIGIALISFAALLAELSLIRVMDVILAPGTGYMVLTSAMFALGLGGIYLYFFPARNRMIAKRIGVLTLVFSIMVLLLIPLFNIIPFSTDITDKNKIMQIFAWSGMYLSLIIPFLMVGLVLAQTFLSFSSEINRLYFYDLFGAGLACLVFIPLVPIYGPGGILFVSSSAGLLASFCFYRPNTLLRYITPILGILVLSIPLVGEGYIEFRGHSNKRNNDVHIQDGKRVHVKWDPVSKLDVFKDVRPDVLFFSIDGGQQGSWLAKFNGNLNSVKHKKDDGRFYNGRGSAIHYLLWKKGIRPEVLFIGSSAGGDIMRAIAFDAKHVDAVELVGAIVNAERDKFRQYGGGWYSHPDVTAIIGEGRTYLRSSKKKYDIIQMHSSHTSSSVESGSGAVQTVYLQTVEAYMEYFQHLTENGGLQINHHIYPRMLTTAAQAWNRLGKKEFWKHVLVMDTLRYFDTLPTMIIKMKPWIQEEVTLVREYMNRKKKRIVERPSPHHPTRKIFGSNVYSTMIKPQKDKIAGVELMIGTHRQNGLPYDIQITLKNESHQVIGYTEIEGASVKDNDIAMASFNPVEGVKGRNYTLEIAAPKATRESGFSVWLSSSNQPVINTIPRSYRPKHYVVFNPIDVKDNLVPNNLLSSPFPTEMTKNLPWNVTPVTDKSPYFSMIRKHNHYIQPEKENMIDRNTAHLLNNRLRDGVPGDWLHLFVTATVSVFFAFIFIVLPLVGTNIKKNTWRGMWRDIVYFSTLGLGFILVEVVFIQLFKKLIGYPTHTFVIVICSLLLSAGAGSAFSKRAIKLVKGKTYIIFGAIIGYGFLFLVFYEAIFHAGLGLPLAGRIMVAIALIIPLGFFLGMPFPLGILNLSVHNDRAIPWAWAINGFFTVVGGLLAILLSLAMNFIVVLVCAWIIYGIALAVSRPYNVKPVF